MSFEKFYLKYIKPEFHIHYDDKDKDIKIEELVRSEENLKTERKSLIQKIRTLERKVNVQEKDIKDVRDDCAATKDNLYDAIYIMLGFIDDPVIKRQVEAKLKA